MAIIFDDGVVRVIIRRRNDGKGPPRGTLVTFADLTFRPDEEKLWGEAPARNLGYDLIGIVAYGENWFPRASMEAAASHVRRRLRPRALAYGYSMGGYGALKYARMMGLSRALAVCPQYSIDPLDVPGDTRFIHRFDPVLHDRMAIRPDELPEFGVQMADPYFPEDATSANAIALAGEAMDPSRGTLHWVRTPFLGHAAIWLLTESAFLDQVFQRVIDADAQGLRDLLRARRGKTPHWFRNVGRAAMMRGRDERASRFWDRATALGLQDWVRRHDLADTLPVLLHRRFHQGRPVEALAALDRLGPQLATDAKAQEQAGHALIAAKQWPAAEACFRASRDLSPASPAVWTGLAAAIDAQGRLEEAIEVAVAGCAALPEDPALAIQAAELLLRGANPAGAEPHFRRALAARPDDPTLLQAFGTALAAQGRTAEAAETLLAARQGAPENAVLAAQAGAALLRDGQNAEAAAQFRSASAANPREAGLHLGLSMALAAAGDEAGALAEAREAVRLNPRDTRALSWLMRRLLRKGQLVDALSHARPLLTGLAGRAMTKRRP